MDTSRISQLQTIVYETNRLFEKVNNYIVEQEKTVKYVYASVYKGWVTELNDKIQKYNQYTSANLSPHTVTDYDLSSTKKTINIPFAKSFAQGVKRLSEKIETDIKSEQEKENPIPLNQMRACFKIGIRGCPHKPDENKNKVFIAMPFDEEYEDSFMWGIKLILDQKGIEYFKADDAISNKDIMCKICQEIQSCRRIIVNISGLNPNVMLELGLAFGLGKEVIIIKDKKTTAVSDLGGLEYIEYSNAVDIQRELQKIL